MKHRIYRITTLAIILLTATIISALDLPIKTIGGVKYYYYKVGKKESVYGISKKLGISREEIIRHNPDAADGVKKGHTLLFPFDEFVPTAESIADTVVAVPEIPVSSDENNPEGIYPDEESAPALRSSISLLMPFGLASEEPSRANKLALDFYKGFLIGLDTLSDRRGEVEINVFDIDKLNAAQVEAVLDSTVVALSAVIIVPEDEAVLHAAATKAIERGNYVLNVLNIPDTLYMNNGRVIQGNTPQRKMYELAAKGLMQDFAGYTPVILRNREGKNEKEAFTAYLESQYSDAGVTPVIIEYSTNLLSVELEPLAATPGKYVCIPSSGSLAEFNRFAHSLKAFRDRMMMNEPDENGNIPEAKTTVALFGYPDWTAFRGDALDLLTKLEATVYSRFYDNFNGFSSKGVEADFRRWFGENIIESIPSHALLGYDTACMLIKNLMANGGEFKPEQPGSHEGVQSVFKFEKTGEGYINSSIYLIKYQADGRITARAL